LKKTLFILVFISSVLHAQIDTAIFVPMVGIHFGAQLPGGDLAKRFGPALNAGGAFYCKTKKNWIFGIESNYFFGRNVREDITSGMKSSGGFVIDNDGFPADIRITERGVGVHASFGRVFKVLSANPNSGLMAMAGAGYLEHRVHIYDAQQRIAAVRGELRYGYDRLTNGYSFTQFIGYLLLSDNRLLNFYFGFEGYEALTKSVRKLNYDTGLPDTAKRLDLILGFRFGWIVPLYKKRPKEFYYN
jgi:hypothetical protein